MRGSRTTGSMVLFAILFLFFLQVLSDFIQSIYAFGLLVTAFTIQLAAVVLLFSSVALLLVRRPPSARWIVGLAAVAMLGRLIEPMLDPSGRLVACGVSVGAFMLLFPSMLAARPRGSILGWPLAGGLLLALLLSIFLRAAGSSMDISEYGIFQFIAWVLAVLAGRLIWETEMGLPRARQDTPPAKSSEGAREPEAVTHEDRRAKSLSALKSSGRSIQDAAEAAATLGARPSTGSVIGLCLGLAGVIVMLYFGFVSPAVMARWTGYPYAIITAVFLLTLVTFGFFLSWRPLELRLSRTLMLVWNGLFVIMLVLTIMAHQIQFPGLEGGYPLDAASPVPAATVTLWLTIILSLVLLVDFAVYARQVSLEAPSVRQLGGGFAVAAAFILIMVFLHVFTTIYDYAAPIGPLFRDRFWLVYLIAGLGVWLPMLLVPDDTVTAMALPEVSRFPFYAAGALAIGTAVALFLTTAVPAPVQAADNGLRVMTYNIQQGFDKVGAADLSGQLAAIRRVAPDVLGLEESDTARLANGNVDAVRYFADHLDMYSYYGPTTTTGTFGIALLSKYPIQNPHTFFMYSPAEQTACIHAEITVQGKVYNIFVTHLGNGGPMIQLQNVLSRVDGLQDVILMGDFNFGPSTPQYALAAQKLQDAWLVKWRGGKQIWQQGGEDRIDLIFVSPGTQVLEAEYVPDPASDHPYLYAVIKR